MSQKSSQTSKSSLKRKADSVDRPISPPATRRKLSPPQSFVGPSRLKPHHFNIYSWNVNGVGPLLQKRLTFTPNSGPESPLREFLKRHHWPSLLCLQEVKIATSDLATQRKLEHAANVGNESGEPTYTTHFSLPKDKYNATGFRGKVYGVATLIRSDVLGLVRETRKVDWDLEGRVLVTEMTTGVAVVNGYWVNGTTNSYRDPKTGEVSGTRHDHKLRFHDEMLRECKRLEKARLHVVLVGDMNVARGRIDGHPNLRTSPVQHVKNRVHFNAKFFTDEDGFRGVDVFRHFHGEARKYTYHPRGRTWGASCDRVDLIIASRGLMEFEGIVSASDICDNPTDRGHSDHVPLWVSFDLDKTSSLRAGSEFETSSGLGR